ncbi:hypothetical protein WJX72_001145 [[Myrmecia] bisecta]|uniref:FAD/NAD(P)-binding domain-containing protein n=1 Tax=[Myrmecia] bisecta TaxID=41462 RepID=A0AAW1QP63_9CHLO
MVRLALPLQGDVRLTGSFNARLTGSTARVHALLPFRTNKFAGFSSGLFAKLFRRSSTDWRAKTHSGSGAAGRVVGSASAGVRTYSSPPKGASVRSGPRVCILGGGFGGLYTAVRLEALLWPRGTKPQVTLIDKNDRFVFKPLLYELINGAASVEEVAPPFQELLAPYAVNFIQGSVQSVVESPSTSAGSSGSGQVVLTSGEAVQYDWLVMALGAESSTFGIPGVKELALPFCTYSDAVKMVQELERLEQSPGLAEVVVVGAGYAGVELATTVAERLMGKGRVKIITAAPDILDGTPSGQREAARRMLIEKRIDIITDVLVKSVRQQETSEVAAGLGVDKRHITLNLPGGQQQVLPADLVLWTAGSGPATATSTQRKLTLPFPATKQGALRTDPTLRVVGHARVFALGDVASSEGEQLATEHLPATAQVAFQQADYVAWNLWAAINNRPLLPFKYQHLGDMMSLGRVNGAVTLPLPIPRPVSTALQSGPLGPLLSLAGIRLNQDDSDKGVTLQGPLAGVLRRAAYWYRQPTNEQRLRVGASWLQQALDQTNAAARRATSGK